VKDNVGESGVKVGRKVAVKVGVGDWYQRGVGVRVRVGGTMGVGTSNASGGYSSNIADRQSNPLVRTNSLNLAAG